MFDPDYAFDLPTGRELLAVAGIDPAAVREVVEHDRAMRCPDRASPRSVRSRARFAMDMRSEGALRGMTALDLPAAAPSRPPAE